MRSITTAESTAHFTSEGRRGGRGLVRRWRRGHHSVVDGTTGQGVTSLLAGCGSATGVKKINFGFGDITPAMT